MYRRDFSMVQEKDCLQLSRVTVAMIRRAYAGKVCCVCGAPACNVKENRKNNDKRYTCRQHSKGNETKGIREKDYISPRLPIIMHDLVVPQYIDNYCR